MDFNIFQTIRMFFQNIQTNQSTSGSIGYTPNENTTRILLQNDAAKEYRRVNSVDELFEDLHK